MIVVYTAIYAGSDRLKQAPKGADLCVCFTDDPRLHGKGWTMRYERRPPHRKPRHAARLVKMNPHTLFPDATMSVWVDPKSYMFRTVEIQTSYEEKPVHFKGDFQPLTAGPTYSARSVLEYPDKGVELSVENYDYQKLAM